MTRIPLLLIALSLFVIGGSLIFILIDYNSTAPAEQVTYFTSLFRLLPFAFIILSIIGFIFWISSLIHMLTNELLVGVDKIVWTLIIIFLNVLGSLLYFVLLPVIQRNSQSTLRNVEPGAEANG